MVIQGSTGKLVRDGELLTAGLNSISNGNRQGKLNEGIFYIHISLVMGSFRSKDLELMDQYSDNHPENPQSFLYLYYVYLSSPLQSWISTRENQKMRRKQRNYLTADKDAQASLLGAKIVKLPGPSISGLRLERSE